MRAITIPPTPSPPPTTRIPRRSSTLPLACCLPSCMVAPAFAGVYELRNGWVCPLQRSPKKRQESDDDDDYTNDIDDVVNKMALRVG